MISILPHDGDGQKVDVAVGRILAEMNSVCDDGDPGSRCFDEETARGVAAFLEERGVPQAHVGPARLRELTARALRATGRNDLADRVLLMGGGLVRESRSSLCGSGTMLVLDLRRIAVQQNERLDMILFLCLSAVLGRTAGIWRRTAGRGILGLRNVRATAESVLGGNGRRKQVLLLSAEIMAICGHNLERLQSLQKWPERPLVVDLDCL